MLEIKFNGDSAIYPIDKLETEGDLFINAKQRLITPFTKNEIYFGCMGCREVVVKMSTQDLLHEWDGQKISYDRGFNVPTPLVLAKKNQIMVSSLLPGQQLTSFRDDDYRVQLGRMIRDLHSIKQTSNWERRGCNDYSFYDEAVHIWACTGIKELAVDSRVHSILNTLSASMTNYLSTAYTGFAHRDVHDEQVLVANGSIGLVDFEHWGDNDLMREVGMYLFHKVRKKEPLSGFESFSMGVLGDKMDANMREVALYYLLFIAGCALKYFSDIQSEYLPIAFYNFHQAQEYAESEEIMR